MSVPFWPLRQSKINPLPLIESILKKYYAPENTNVPPNPTVRNVWCTDDGRTKIRPEKCLTLSHKDKIHFYGSDSTRNGGYALTPMPWTGPAPRTRTGRGLQHPSPPRCVVQGRPTVCASNRRSPMCFAFSTHWLRSARPRGSN